jgi:hypothetical protein
MKLFLTVGLLIYLFCLNSPKVHAQDSCIKVKESEESFCGTLPNALSLEIKNNCSENVRSTFCYENSTSQWECMSDTVFQGEDFYGFMSCNAKGNYLIKNCIAGEADCLFESVVPLSVITCPNGENVNYSIVEQGANKISLKTDDGLYTLAFTHVKNTPQFTNAQFIAKSICKESESLSSQIVNKVKTLIQEQVEKYSDDSYEACLVEHRDNQEKKSGCNKKIAGIGVRG